MNESLCSVDWLKVAHVLQALLTPVIGIATVVIGVIAIKIQRQHAETNRLQHRLALFERRMKVFDATQEFIVLVIRNSRIDTMKPLFALIRNTREHRMLFGPEIGKYIDELYAKGGRLHVIDAAGGGIIKPEHIQEETEIQLWFSKQAAVAEEKFLKYIDFQKP